MRTRISLFPKSFAKNEPMSVVLSAVFCACKERLCVAESKGRGEKERAAVSRSLTLKKKKRRKREKEAKAKGNQSLFLSVKEETHLKKWHRVFYAKT